MTVRSVSTPYITASASVRGRMVSVLVRAHGPTKHKAHRSRAVPQEH